MKATYRVLAYLVPILVALQASFIALGNFGLGKWVEDGNSLTKSVLESDNSNVTGDVGYMLHGLGALAMVVVGLVLLVVSFFAKIEGGVKWAALIFADVILQWVLAFASFAVWAIGIFHGLNAFVLFGLGVMAVRAATSSMGKAPAEPAVTA